MSGLVSADWDPGLGLGSGEEGGGGAFEGGRGGSETDLSSLADLHNFKLIHVIICPSECDL
jgi:hypothetical protein